MSYFLLFSLQELAGVLKRLIILTFPEAAHWFLSDKQIQEDLVQTERLLQENYVRYPILEQKGVSWKSAFKNLEDRLLPDT